MRLRVDFGANGYRREVTWWRPLDDFPRLFRFNGKKWEWFMFDRDPSAQVDWILTYSQLPTYDPNFSLDMPDFDEQFGQQMGQKCECGAIYTSFAWDHMRFCPMWRKW